MTLIMRYCARLKLQVNHFVYIGMAVKNYHTGIVTVRNPVCHIENMIQQINLTWYQHQYTTEQTWRLLGCANCSYMYMSLLFARFNIFKWYSLTV